MDSDIYRVDSVITKGITVLNTMSVKKLHDIFVENSSIMGVTVIKNSLPIGIITRERLMLYLSGRFGYSLYEKKTVDLVMDINYLSVDLSSNINEVAIRAMDRSMHKIYDFIVVVKKGAYYGVIEVRDLLLKYTEISVMRARNLNPLSGLPGNCEIEEEIKKIISTNEEYTVMYIDIDNFKVFNDNYGFDKGDKIILTLSDILKKYMLEGDFIGHIGGDDFIFIKKGYKGEKNSGF